MSRLREGLSRAERGTMSSNHPRHPLIPPSESRTSTPHHNDVLCGSGETIDDHPGNKEYRKMVDNKTKIYLRARFKRGKRLVATGIVEQIRNLNPPGRFLMKEGKNSRIWFDIGDVEAREKVSLALQENALAEIAEKKKRQGRDEAITAGKYPQEAVRLVMKSLDRGKKDVKKPVLPVTIHAPALRAMRQPKERAAVLDNGFSLDQKRPETPQEDPVLAVWQGRYVEFQTIPPASKSEVDRGLRKCSKNHGGAKDDYLIRDPRRRESLSSYYRTLKECPETDATLREICGKTPPTIAA